MHAAYNERKTMQGKSSGPFGTKYSIEKSVLQYQFG
jgi:hypothetical protein